MATTEHHSDRPTDNDTPTHEVITWFLDNPDEHLEAITRVSDYSDGEISGIDEPALKRFIKKQLPTLEMENVDWDEVIVELFV